MTRFYLYIALINLLDLAAVVAGKMWSLTGKPLYLVLCGAGFAAAGTVFALSLKYEGAAITNVLWIAISIVLVTILGYFVFKETIGHWQLLGIGVIIIGIILLNIR